MSRSRILVMVEVALAIALAVVLGRIKVLQMPMGGSVSLGMLPVFVVALRRGLLPGLVAGALYGIADLAFDPSVVHPVQFLLDYPVAYGAIGLAGAFSTLWHRAKGEGRAMLALAVWPLAATLAGGGVRFAAHWLSGFVYFGQYAPPGQPAWLYSLLYNGSYMSVSVAMCAVAVVALLPVLERVTPSVAPASS